LKALSFLGTTDYKPTTYVRDGLEYETEFFGETLPHFFPDLDKVLVFVTPTVREHPNMKALQERLGDQFEPVHIPEGHSEDELWAIFDALIDAVDEDEQVLFDITNSFRSIPLLVFLAAAYLRTARGVRLRGVIYGAFEARDKATNRTPVFDLTPFVVLLDWLTATNQFIHTGNARYLAHLLEGQGRQRHSNALKRAGRSLNGLSLAMMLCRPLEIMEEAGGIVQALSGAAQDVALWTRPFMLLADRIEREYAARALADPTSNVVQSLQVQLDLIGWYLDNNQIIQAVTLAREWAITLAGYRLGKGFELDRDEREKNVRWGLGELARLKSGRTREEKLTDTAMALKRLPEADRLRRVWDKLIGIRNDLDHAGMSEQRATASSLVKRTRELVPELDALFEQAMQEQRPKELP